VSRSERALGLTPSPGSPISYSPRRGPQPPPTAPPRSWTTTAPREPPAPRRDVVARAGAGSAIPTAWRSCPSWGHRRERGLVPAEIRRQRALTRRRTVGAAADHHPSDPAVPSPSRAIEQRELASTTAPGSSPQRSSSSGRGSTSIPDSRRANCGVPGPTWTLARRRLYRVERAGFRDPHQQVTRLRRPRGVGPTKPANVANPGESVPAPLPCVQPDKPRKLTSMQARWRTPSVLRIARRVRESPSARTQGDARTSPIVPLMSEGRRSPLSSRPHDTPHSPRRSPRSCVPAASRRRTRGGRSRRLAVSGSDDHGASASTARAQHGTEHRRGLGARTGDARTLSSLPHCTPAARFRSRDWS